MPRNKVQICEFVFQIEQPSIYLLYNEHKNLISLDLTSSVFFNSGKNGTFSLWSMLKSFSESERFQNCQPLFKVYKIYLLPKCKFCSSNVTKVTMQIFSMAGDSIVKKQKIRFSQHYFSNFVYPSPLLPPKLVLLNKDSLSLGATEFILLERKTLNPNIRDKVQIKL